MPDRPSPPIADREPDALKSRLDALGRRLVEDESRRIQPPRAYLDAAAERALTVRLRFWTPRLAIAATLLLAGAAAFILSRPAPRSGPAPISGIPDAAYDSAAPTVANLHTANRSITSPEQLRLPSGQGTAADSAATPVSPYRASDTRDPERIDVLLGEK